MSCSSVVAAVYLIRFGSLLYCLHACFGTECVSVRNTKYSCPQFKSSLGRSEMFAQFCRCHGGIHLVPGQPQ